MKASAINALETVILELQDEIRRSPEARYQHRLHALLLIVRGMTTAEVAGVLGDSPRTIQYWVRRFEDEGFAGLADTERSGRPRRLSEQQLSEINMALCESPERYELGSDRWDGKTLSAFISRKYCVDLGIRQCQRLFRQLDFQLHKRPPGNAEANDDQQRGRKIHKPINDNRPDSYDVAHDS